MRKQVAIFNLIILLICAVLSGCVGGPCSYDSYNGVVTITFVSNVENTSEEMENESDEYQVMYVFTLNDNESIREKHESLYETISTKELEFILLNGWHPNKEYLQKYNIEENKTFECELKLITEGTCSPWIFDIKDVDRTDYSTFNMRTN